LYHIFVPWNLTFRTTAQERALGAAACYWLEVLFSRRSRAYEHILAYICGQKNCYADVDRAYAYIFYFVINLASE